MKELLIEGHRAVISQEDFYIPFTFKVTDVENPEVIGLPVSKTVTLPRVQQNDEILGHIGELSRITIGGDNEIGVKFNQIKKCTYELFNNGESVSKGLITVDSVSKDSYNVTLVDNLVNLLEKLSGDNAKLSLVDLYHSEPGGQPFNFNITATAIRDLNTYNYGIVPTFNIDEDAEEKKSILCVRSVGGNTVTDLPTDCTQMNIKTFKSYETNFAIKLKTLFESLNRMDYGFGTNWLILDDGNGGNYLNEDSEQLIESQTPNDNYITENGNTSNIFNEIINDVHLFCKQPKQETSAVLTDYNLLPASKTNPFYTYELGEHLHLLHSITTLDLKESDNTNIPNDVNLLRMNVNLKMTFNLSSYNEIICHQYNDTYPSGKEWTWNNVSYNDFVGSLWVNASIKIKGKDGNYYFSKPSKFKIDLRWGVSFKIPNQYSGGAYVECMTPFNFAYPGKLIDITYIPKLILWIDAYPESGNDKTYLFLGHQYQAGAAPHPGLNKVEILESTVQRTFQKGTGFNITAKNILPETKIKDFLLSFIKYFNLDIEATADGRLRIFKRLYSTTRELLLLDNIEAEVNTKIISNDKFVLTTNKPSNELINNYEKTYLKTWCEKIVNTGYSIKENKKEIKFDVGISNLQTDTNSWAYDMFNNFRYGGYSENHYGYTKGLSDISFGYLNVINEQLYVSNSSPSEFGYTIYMASEYPYVKDLTAEVKTLIVNDLITYDDATSNPYLVFTYRNQSNSIFTYRLDSFYTFSPYKFTNGVVERSLEMNKPIFNWAGLNDTTYPGDITVPPYKDVTHFYRFFKNKFQDVYSQNTHIIKTKMFIDGKINLDKIYNIDGVHYIISNLPEYDLTKPDLYEVELLRVDDVNNYSNPFN